MSEREVYAWQIAPILKWGWSSDENFERHPFAEEGHEGHAGDARWHRLGTYAKGRGGGINH